MAHDPARPVGRPPVPAEVRKDAVLSVRMTQVEYAAVLARATSAREPLGQYVRERLLSVYNNSGSAPSVAD